MSAASSTVGPRHVLMKYAVGFIAAKKDDEGVSVSFADTGPGMTGEQRERAFTGMLSTTKEKGAGLGLAIVAKVAEAHGGRVEVNAREGEGTTITFRLPVTD